MPKSIKRTETIPTAGTSRKKDTKQASPKSAKTTSVFSFRADRNVRAAIAAYKTKVDRKTGTSSTRNEIIRRLIEQQLVTEGVLVKSPGVTRAVTATGSRHCDIPTHPTITPKRSR